MINLILCGGSSPLSARDVEVQVGESAGEVDIIRIEDDFHRK